MNGSTQLQACLFIVVAIVLSSLVRADQITLHPVQSGLVSDGSCCSPYTYSNSSESLLRLTGCFDSTYGCGHRKDYGAWRWAVADALPEGATISSALLRWNHPDSCWSSYTDIWIDATSSTLTSAYLSGIPADQTIIDHQYWSSMVTLNVDASVITDAMTEGYVSVKIGNGTGADGCNFINQGVMAPRLIISFEDPIPPCPGDLDGNRVVDGTDISRVLGWWGSSDANADVDGNGVVDGGDLTIILGGWGDCPQ
jgi:hypothetical protein